MIRAESTDWKNKPLTSKYTTVSIDRLLLNRHADLPDNNDIESIMRNWSFFGNATLEDDGR